MMNKRFISGNFDQDPQHCSQVIRRSSNRECRPSKLTCSRMVSPFIMENTGTSQAFRVKSSVSMSASSLLIWKAFSIPPSSSVFFPFAIGQAFLPRALLFRFPFFLSKKLNRKGMKNIHILI